MDGAVIEQEWGQERERKEHEPGSHKLPTPADPSASRARGARGREGVRRGGLGGGLEKEEGILMRRGGGVC